MTLDPDLTRRSVCDIETIGRVSGRPRPFEIWFAADPERDRIYVLSGGRDRAHWVRNIRKNPSVAVRIAGRWFAGAAVEIEGGPDDGLARRLLAEKYQGWTDGQALSGWARHSLPVAIDLRATAGPAPAGATGGASSTAWWRANRSRSRSGTTGDGCTVTSRSCRGSPPRRGAAASGRPSPSSRGSPAPSGRR